MADPIDAIDRALGELVRRPNLPRFHAHLASAAGLDHLERGALTVLRFVHHHQPVRQADLAEALGVDQSTVSRHVTRLEGAGLVTRRPDPEDGRVALLEVSEHGRAAHEALHRARRAMLAEVLADWSPEERTRLAGDLHRLIDGVAAYMERR